MKVLIIGGVAGGATAAARLRRNDEHARIILFERGGFVSFANCGLPYYVGGVIRKKSDLVVQTPEGFSRRFRIDVRLMEQVVSISRKEKTVSVRKNGSVYRESYDKLILSPGAEPIRPALPGFDGKKVFSVRGIPDALAIREFCERSSPESAVIIGGGYIGIEMVENLSRLGIRVTVVEQKNHVIPAIDPDTAAEVQNYLRSKGVELRLNTGVGAIEETGSRLVFHLTDGPDIAADFAVLSVGVSPESKLAAEAGLKTGVRGTIAVDESMRTSDPDIYAVGDAVQVTNAVSGEPVSIPLASPANRQGRIAADHICGEPVRYDGAQGSSILKVFDLVLAATGLSETALKAAGTPYRKSYTYSPSNASYYPGGAPMSIKLLFSPDGGRLLGAQAVGSSGVDKRIDVIASVLRMHGTVEDLTRLELCYAPPFSSAKDPMNMAGYVAENILKHKVFPFYAEDVDAIDPRESVLVDTRTKAEFEGGTIPGAVNFPLDSLREEMEKLPKNREIDVFCQIGLRGYLASRILLQSGFSRVRNLSGGYRLWNQLQENRAASRRQPETE